MDLCSFFAGPNVLSLLAHNYRQMEERCLHTNLRQPLVELERNKDIYSKSVKRLCLYFFLIGLICFSCKKENDIGTRSIEGKVQNLTNDSGFAGIKVFLIEKNKNNIENKLEAITTSEGKFLFPGIFIRESAEFNYTLSIPSVSGIGSNSEVAIDGDVVTIDKADAGKLYTLNIVPRFLALCYQSNISFPIQQPDSLYIFFRQETLHKNIGWLPYSGLITNNSTINSCTSDYPMGLWYFTIEKWKGGTYTKTEDSLYLGWGDTKTYTINW
jgi:hypothetical protein